MWGEFKKTNYNKLQAFYKIALKVIFIRSLAILVFGIWCSQLCWVLPCIMSKLPGVKSKFMVVLGMVLCLNWNFRVAPNETEAIMGFWPSSGSLSACQPMYNLKNIPKKGGRAAQEAVFNNFSGHEAYLVFYLWRSLSGGWGEF